MISTSTTSVAGGALTQRRLLSPRFLIYAVAIVLAVLFGLPLLWAALSSLKTYRELYIFPPTWFPEAPQWVNYRDAWTSAPFGRFFINSTTVTLLSVVGTLLSCSFVGYGFARFRFPGRGVLFLIVLSTLILPHQVTVIPRFLLYREFGWLDTLLPLWVPWFFGGSAFGIFLFRQFFLTIPNDLDQSARIDGAGFLTIFARILMPLSQSVTVSLAILTFLASWNELFWPIIVLNTYEKYTLALGLQYFRTLATAGGELREHLLMAGALMMTSVVLVVFVALQRYFTQGIVLSGLKG